MEVRKENREGIDSVVISVTPEELLEFFPGLADHSDISSLDAVQESSEAHAELYDSVQRGSTAAGDAVMCQESTGFPAELESRVDDGGVGDA